MSRQPVMEFRSSISLGISIAVWPGHENKGYGFTIKKRYKNKSGEWVDGATFYPGDLAAIAFLAHQAIDWADGQRAADREQRNGGPAQQAGIQKRFSERFQESEATPSKQESFADDDIPF